MNNFLKSDLLVDLSSLTTVHKASLDRLVDMSYKCLCQDVQEALLENIETICIDIGIGNLFINISTEFVKYRFEPNQKLKDCLINTIKTKESPIIKDIEDSLVEKINTVYKELF